MDLILASASPRRVELLELLGLPFTQQPADIDESYRAPETPAEYVLRMALEKASLIAAVATADAVVIGADTTVLVDDPGVATENRFPFGGPASTAYLGTIYQQAYNSDLFQADSPA